MKTILHITPFCFPDIGGVETYLFDLFRKLDEIGYHNIVLTYSPISTPNVTWEANEKFAKHSLIRRFHWVGHNLFHKLEKYPVLNLLYITPYLLIRSIIWLAVHHSKVTTIHSHGINGAMIGIVLKKIFRINKHIVSIYSTYDNVPINAASTKFVVSVLNSTDKVLTQSRQSIEQLTAMGVKPEKLALYRHWIDLKQFRSLNKVGLRKQMGLENKFSVIFIGRMIPVKGALLLAKVAAKLPQINFLFVGNGPDYPKLEKLSSTSSNIKLLGNVPYEKLHLYYNLADVFCMPSLYNEGWGRVLMESLACGVPVVASARGAIVEVVDSSVALVVPPTLTNLKNAIEKLRSNHQLYQKLKNNTVKYARKNFSDSSVTSITGHYA